MRASRLRTLLSCTAFLALVLSGAKSARAEADTFGLGSGQNGALTVTSTTGLVVNTYASVAGNITAGTKTLTIGTAFGASTTFTAGELVMILETHGGLAAPLTSGSATGVTLSSATNTGRYEIARIASVEGGTTLILTHAVVNAYDGGSTQVISVPEYTTVTINAGAKLTATPWDSATAKGGVLAFLAQGAVANAGTIDVSGAGFSGGLVLTDANSDTGCNALDGVPLGGGAAAGGAHKGEGIDPTAFGIETTYTGATAHHFGRGNVGNAGGGGDCFNAGGGGGGHGAAGGSGGHSNNTNDGDRAVGGNGGVAVTYDPTTNLSLGGGGGAGEDDDGIGGSGGAGGGLVWLRANSLTGLGSIDADGAAGGSAGIAATPTYSDGAGGGGAGGGVYAWLDGPATCGGITARGGAGGDAVPAAADVPIRNYGPGGGGGGGIVRVASNGAGVCTATVTSGASGVTSLLDAYGATAGTNGSATTGSAFTTTGCNFTSGLCGGCTSNSFCPPSDPVCATNPGTAQYTCISPAAYGDPPAGGETCVGGATPTQGTSQGCQGNLCDTKDGDCGYANGTACATPNECRSNLCIGGVCAVPEGGADAGLEDGGSSSADGGAKDGGSASDGGSSTTDGGASTGDGGQGNLDGGNQGNTSGDASVIEGESLEGGGIDCNTSNSSPSNVLVFLGLAGIVGVIVRKAGKRRV